MKNELKEIIQEKCRKFVKYNSFDFNEFENNVLEIFEKIKENEYYDREYNYEIKNFIDKTLINEYGRYNELSKLSKELKSIENLIEGNEYFDGGVSYCVGIDKIDGAVSLDFAIKKCLLEMEAIVSSEMKIVITPIKYPRDEIKNLCTEWHLNEQICNKMLSTSTCAFSISSNNIIE